MNKIIKKNVLICVGVLIMIFSSCEKEIIEIKSNDVNLTGKTHFVSINDVPFLFPSIEKFNADYNFLSNPSLKRRDGVQDLNLELSKIVEYAADNGCDSYSIPIKNELDINQDYYFENLNVTKLGDQFQPFITRFTASNQEKFSLTTFSGKIEILDLNKTLITTLPFENGQLKIPPVFVPRDFENDSSTGGGAGTGNGPGGFITWVLNQLGYSVLWSTMNNSWQIVSNGNSSSSSGINSNSNNDGSNLGNISLFPNGTQTWSTSNSSPPNTNGGNGGSFTIVPNPPTWIEDNTLTDQINLIIQRLQPSANASRWLKNPVNSQSAQEVYSYLYQNPNINNSDDFVKNIIDLAISETNLADVKNLIGLSLRLQKNSTSEITINLVNSLDSFMDLNTIDPVTNALLIQYFTIQCAIIRHNHPSYSNLKVYWEASKSAIHLTLDAFGLIPVYGEIADLSNGVLYAIEGDGLNASLSVASAVPIIGWASVGTKYGIMILVTVTGKTKLVWKIVNNVIQFGDRGQLRKVLNLAVGNPFIAHHIMPWALQTKTVIQRAAKYANPFHMNSPLNGIALSNVVHTGNHQAYSDLIADKLDDFIASNPNATPQECYNFLTNLIQRIRLWIINNPITNINQMILP